MGSPKKKASRLWMWIRWFLFSEGLILLFAFAGPGYRHALRRRGYHALFARLFFEEPTYLQAVAVNFVVFNLLVFGAWFEAWAVTQLRNKR